MMKSICTALSIWLLIAQSTFAAPQATSQKAANQKATEQAFEFFKKAKDDLDVCNIKYATYLLRIRNVKQRKEVEILEADAASGTGVRSNRRVSMQEVIDEVSPIHKSCIDDAKNARIQEAPKALAGIKKARTKELAKDTFAQWITAIDSIGSDNDEAEGGKFKALLNRLIVEFAE